MAAQCDTRPPILMTTLEGEGCSDAARDFASACIKGLGLGFRVQVSGFGVQGAGFRVWDGGLWFRSIDFWQVAVYWGVGFGVQGLGFQVSGSWFEVWVEG